MSINFDVKRLIILIFINLFILSLIGCNKADIESNASINMVAPEVKVIYSFATDLSNKKYAEAFDKLGIMLRKAYSGPDDIHFKNIQSMEILELFDKTYAKENGKWDINNKEIGENIYIYKVYYASVNYTISNIAESYLKNGINYHKITVYKETKDSEWKIGEISSTDKI